MRPPDLFLALEALLFLVGAEGQQLSDFLLRHKSAIERFIMIGHGKGWKHCDILSPLSVQDIILDSSAQPQMTVDLKRLLDMNLSIVLSSSSCILISYQINSNQSLASLIKLGTILIRHQQFFLLLVPPPHVRTWYQKQFRTPINSHLHLLLWYSTTPIILGMSYKYYP